MTRRKCDPDDPTRFQRWWALPLYSMDNIYWDLWGGGMALTLFSKHVLSNPHFLDQVLVVIQTVIYTQRNTYLHMRSHTTTTQKHSGVWHHQSTTAVKPFNILYKSACNFTSFMLALISVVQSISWIPCSEKFKQ